MAEGTILMPVPSSGSAPSPKLKPVTPVKDTSKRRVTVLSFWAVALLGVPYWWKTTTVERLELPSAEIQSWRERAPCYLRPTVNLAVSSKDEGILIAGVDQLRSELPTFENAGCINVRIGTGKAGMSPGSCSSQPQNRAEFPLIDANGYELHIGEEDYLDSRRKAESRIGGDLPATYNSALLAASTLLDLSSAPADPRVVKFASTYKLVFSLLNQDATKGDAILDWEIQKLLNTHIRPLLTSLAPLHEFTIETRVQYFAPLSVSVEKRGNASIIKEDDLRAFVNPAEWNMPSSVTLDPVMQFIVYVPSSENRPLQIRQASGLLSPSNAFLTPQWGGVVIHNPAADSPSDLNEPFRFFRAQLQQLLGVPKHKSTSSGSLAQWQVDAMVRKRLAEATKETVETLWAIVKLVDDIPNMRVGEEVQRDVGKALAELVAAESALPSSPELALHHSATALQLASKAYYNPTMLALLYFPDEHKYAIYTPLFGPVAVPLIMALIKEFKSWKEKRKGKKEGKEKAD